MSDWLKKAQADAATDDATRILRSNAETVKWLSAEGLAPEDFTVDPDGSEGVLINALGIRVTVNESKARLFTEDDTYIDYQYWSHGELPTALLRLQVRWHEHLAMSDREKYVIRTLTEEVMQSWMNSMANIGYVFQSMTSSFDNTGDWAVLVHTVVMRLDTEG